MFIISLTVLLCLTKWCSSQNILKAMENDNRISLFYNIIKSNPGISQTFEHPYLCILAPSNDAISGATITPSTDFINKHLFDSVQANDLQIQGLISNWAKYAQVPTSIEMVYSSLSIAGTPLYFTNLTVTPPMVNGAQVITQDLITSNQVYHIIDRVLPDGYKAEFVNVMKSSAISNDLAQSNIKWQSLIKAFQEHSFKNGSTFTQSMLSFSNAKPGTVLMPTNDAWTSLSQADQTRLNDPDQLAIVMARLYIPNRIMFLHNKAISFNAGFIGNSLQGNYYRSSQTGMIKVENYVATVITPNIPFTGGVMHIIGSSMAVLETINSYLQRRAPAFYTAISADTDLANAAAAPNVTVLAISDSTMAEIIKLDPVTRKQMLLNCFISGGTTLSNSNNKYFTTAGNATVRIKIIGGRIFVDTVASMSEKTFTNRATVLNSDDTVQGINVNIINGTIGQRQYNCTDMFSLLDRRYYSTLISSLGVTLNIGSPYTLFVPSDDAMRQLTGNNNNRSMSSSTISTLLTTITTTLAPSNGTVGTATTMASNTLTTGTTSSSSSTSTNLRYLIQRMIVANRLPMALRSTGQFKAATMNYAAMQEMIDVSIDQNSLVFIGFKGVMISGPAVDDGFYCYSNDPSSADRRNLIYPVNNVLVTGQDSSQSICVTAPCVGTVISYLGPLLLVLNCAVYWYTRIW